MMYMCIYWERPPVQFKSVIIHVYLETNVSIVYRGLSRAAMVLGELPVSGRSTIWITEGQGPTVLAVGAGGVVWTFLLSSILSLLFLSLFGRRPDID